jgi:hypothetical protein
MALEKTAFHLKVSFVDSLSAAHTFCAAGKTLPGYQLGDKLDTTTDCSGPIKEYLSADQYEITDMVLTLPLDLCEMDTLRQLISDIGILTITSTYTSVAVVYTGAWISSVIASAIELDGQGTYDVTFEFGGGIAGAPAVSGC